MVGQVSFQDGFEAVNGLMGKRNGHAFTGADGYQCDADWNAGFNLAKWDGFSCALELKEAAPVMGSVASKRGVFDSPLNSMKALKGEQLELFVSPQVYVIRMVCVARVGCHKPCGALLS